LYFILFDLLPLVIGLLTSFNYLKKDNRKYYIINLTGTIFAGIITLLLMYTSLFEDALSTSSTASLIFLFVPIYATIAYIIGYWLSFFILETKPEISSFSRKLIIIPIIILVILLAGIIKISIDGKDRSLAYSESNSKILTNLYQKSLNGEVDSFSIPLGLTQNPNTPSKILRQLAKHNHRAIRTHVAQHKNTQIDVILILETDTKLCVRKAALKRSKSLNKYD